VKRSVKLQSTETPLEKIVDQTSHGQPLSGTGPVSKRGCSQLSGVRKSNADEVIRCTSQALAIFIQGKRAGGFS
jgi:hypothetical protein